MEYLIKQYKKKTGTDVSKNLRALGKLKCEVEKAKWTLSSQQSTRIEIESFEDGNDFSETLTRAKFEELNMDLFRKTTKPVEQVLKDANIKEEAIAKVVLVSGSTRIPKVQQLLKEYFGGKEPSKGINPDEAVACGAAVQGGILSGAEETSSVVLADVYPLILGIETTGGIFTKLIPRNTVIPTRKLRIFSTAADKQPTVLIQVFKGECSLTKDNNLLDSNSLASPPALWLFYSGFCSGQQLFPVTISLYTILSIILTVFFDYSISTLLSCIRPSFLGVQDQSNGLGLTQSSYISSAATSYQIGGQGALGIPQCSTWLSLPGADTDNDLI